VRRAVLAFIVTFVVGLSGVATAAVFSGSPSGGPSSLEKADHDKADDASDEASGIHGGPIERLHGAGGCGLTAVGQLPGNWTHGDYVSAVAAGDSAANTQAAAHSDCGKPMVAVGHGPPGFALEHAAAGKAHAGGAGSAGEA
jgi:hypothetical protein